MFICLPFYISQIDSQRLDSNFPVVLSAFPQPKSVALDSGNQQYLNSYFFLCEQHNREAF